ncbi:2OG-Fe(II)oxygenase superfamily protein [Colletotrichum costaricense]|uniref:2OG-Fe(II)oxygenase superfamily protein n=1 Tax=Colletotrichum costaricense TaxID=1209916 RepID=A0AAI9YNQ4_9PEZI|nr:2OG-Fe(II)oxygenase superfamily protein [Colletotrichum costaricense]KAK1517846.1 2OG-Fe(II)oxygenase superfamily protein [Colletotrichum costaricense]
MPSAIFSEPVSLPKWQRPAKTKHELPWADIAVIDISKFDQPGGKKQLAEELRQAVHETGFFSLINTGFTPEEVQRQYDIGQGFFNLDAEDKARPGNTCDFSKGNYFGYRSAHDKKMQGTDVLNNVESVNIAKFIPKYKDEPFHPFFEPFRQEIEDFSRRSLDLASKVFTLFSIILELPEDYFSTRHAYASPSEDHLRYMGYHPRPLADDLKVGNTWSRAHTDFGSLTLLWSQDVAGLQIKTSSSSNPNGAGEWRYVPPVDGGIVCNVGDTLDFWSAGYLKSTTHRVVRPPEDQAHLFRQGLFYFVRPGDDVDIKPAPSPLLKRLGLIGENAEEAAPVRGLQYVRERVKDYHDHNDYADMKGKKFRVGNLEIEDEAE